MRVFNGFFGCLDFPRDIFNLWEIESLAAEGIADPFNSVTDVATVPEYDDINRSLRLWDFSFLYFSTVVLFNVHERLSLGGSEYQFSQP